MRRAGDVLGLFVAVAGVVLLFREVQDLPPRPTLGGIPDSRQVTGWILGGVGAVIAFGSVAGGRVGRPVALVRGRINPWELGFQSLGVIGIGLVGTLNAFVGGLVLAAFAVETNLRSRPGWPTGREAQGIRLRAGGHLLVVAVGYIWMYRYLESRGVGTGLGSVGTMLALLAPGVRLIASSFVSSRAPHGEG